MIDRNSGTGYANEDWRWDENRLQGLIGYKVVDNAGDKVGTVAYVWEDADGEPAYLGVKTGWLGMGRNHVIPARSVTWNEGEETIRLPFAAQAVKNAPTFSEDELLDQAAEDRIYTYYRSFGYSQPRGDVAEGGSATETEMGAEDRAIPLHEEELTVGKRQVEAGGVRLRKIIRTEIVNQPVEIKREDIEIERVPAAGQATGDTSFNEEEIYIPLRREEAVIAKRAHLREEVRVRKTEQRERQEVSEELRKEDVEVVHEERK